MFILLLIATASSSEARPEFWQLFKNYYKVDASKPNGQATCKNCHSEVPQRNSYGKALEPLVNASKDNMLTIEMLKQVEGTDSDGDGWTNGDEIKQGFLPGDPTSHPTGKPSDKSGQSSPGSDSTGGSIIPTHGFHPAVVHFPIALFLFGVFLEFLGLRKKSQEFGKAALWNLIGALASIGVVAPTGVAAWLLGGHKLEGTMLIHLLLAISSILLMIGTLAARKKLGNTDRTYLAILVVAALLISATGYFGGQLVYG